MRETPRQAGRSTLVRLLLLVAAAATLLSTFAASTSAHGGDSQSDLDRQLRRVLRDAGFTGGVESRLEQRLGRRLDRRRAELGRLLFFDNILGLHDDNSCAGCHSPAAGFGDSQPMAIGVDNNGIVGAHRMGPRNQRRAPLS